MNVGTKEVYSEVYSVLNMLGENYIKKLPTELFKIIREEKNNEYNPIYNGDVSLSEQKIDRKSLSMIALFHINYWCETEDEKIELRKIFKENQQKHEKYLREKYNPDNLFKNKVQQYQVQENTVPNEVAMVEYKEGFFKKFLNKIKRLFKKNK